MGRGEPGIRTRLLLGGAWELDGIAEDLETERRPGGSPEANDHERQRNGHTDSDDVFGDGAWLCFRLGGDPMHKKRVQLRAELVSTHVTIDGALRHGGTVS